VDVTHTKEVARQKRKSTLLDERYKRESEGVREEACVNPSRCHGSQRYTHTHTHQQDNSSIFVHSIYMTAHRGQEKERVWN
jgi:hypothetical protein